MRTNIDSVRGVAQRLNNGRGDKILKKRKIKAHREIVWARTNKAAMQKLTEYEREFYVTHHKNKTHGWRTRAMSVIEHRLYKMGVLIPDKSSLYYVCFPEQFARTRQTSDNWPVRKTKEAGRNEAPQENDTEDVQILFKKGDERV